MFQGGEKKKKKKNHNYFCGNVLLTRTKFSDNHEIAGPRPLPCTCQGGVWHLESGCKNAIKLSHDSTSQRRLVVLELCHFKNYASRQWLT